MSVVVSSADCHKVYLGGFVAIFDLINIITEERGFRHFAAYEYLL